ncbi:MAG: agmatinase [Syntrophobacterales bacterium]|nr:agmatinase [Syntrophobacterales bacterium]
MSQKNTLTRGILLGGSPYSFLGLEKTSEAFENARVVLLPVPYDGTTTYQSGTREGPRAIIMASRELEPFDEETGTEPYRYGIFTLNELDVIVRSPEEMVSKVTEVGREIIHLGKLPVMIGGEHLLTLGMIRAIAELGSDWGVLHIDAHADLRKSYQGSTFSNACVMRLVLNYTSVVSVGVRSLTKEEFEFAKLHPVPIFFCRDFIENRVLWDRILDLLPQKIYVTIDLDAFDPSIMPSVGTPEPGGLGWYEMISFLRMIFAEKTIIGFDVMELKPIPSLVAPDFLAAKLIYKLIAYFLFGHSL